MMVPMEMALVSEMEVLKKQIWVSRQVGQHYQMGSRKWMWQAQSVGGLVGSMTSQSMDYIG
jgi:frataxin-like iron-binding protein CyaY